jgi:rubredoxin
MTKYKCTICNYIYDTEKGEHPEIKPGTKLEDLPHNWVCTSCGISNKRMFVKIENE